MILMSMENDVDYDEEFDFGWRIKNFQHLLAKYYIMIQYNPTHSSVKDIYLS